MLLAIVLAIGTARVCFRFLDTFSRLVVAEMSNISLDAPRAGPLLCSKGERSA